MKPKNSIYILIQEIREVKDTKEVAKLLASGDWIAVDATSGKEPLFVMGKVT